MQNGSGHVNNYFWKDTPNVEYLGMRSRFVSKQQMTKPLYDFRLETENKQMNYPHVVSRKAGCDYYKGCDKMVNDCGLKVHYIEMFSHWLMYLMP